MIKYFIPILLAYEIIPLDPNKGKYNKEFVEEEFNKFILGCSQVERQFSHKE